MLQRAASNAYSWWWAGHIRTKQSKWLEQSLQDMEEKVEYVLKLIQEDGDSFAKRAEMYYKKRPELINFVEEFYRAFRALAERYDSLSTELQNANTTIATCFPEQVQFAMDDEDDYNSTKNPKFNLPQGPNPNLPKVPKVPNRVLKGMITDGSKKLQPKKPTDTKRKVPKSGLTKGEALEEIDKLQKDILALQTTKEFVKSSYENGISKYWGLENEIMEKQERVSRLQDEFGEGTVIDDNDARTLMAEAALKSCQETLAQLQDKQERSAAEAKAENKKIEDARQRLKSLKHKFLPDQTDDETIDENLDPGKVQEEDLPSVNKEEVGPEGQKLEVLREKIKEQFETGSIGSITVKELAQKVDDLVNKVISLEGSVSSQTVLIDRLRTEADDLHSQIQSLEDEKETLLGGTHNLKRVKKMEEKLYGVQNLNKNFITQNVNLQTHFTEAHSSLDQLSVKIQNVTPDEESDVTGSLPEAEGSIIEGKLQEALEKQNKGEGGDNVVNNNTSGTDKKADEIEKNISASPVNNQKGEGKEANGKSDTSQVPKQQEEVENKEEGEKKDSSQTTERPLNVEPQKSETEKAKEFEDELNWQQMLLSGLEDKERILLTEYTTILRNYKEVKKKLSEEEKKNDTLFETTVQVRDLKSVVSKKDQEIQSLRHKLNVLQGESGEANDSAENENFCSPPTEEEEAEIKFLINQPQTISPIEEKLRGKIDAILDENLEFWLRFSAVFHQVQKFKTEVQDLQAEILQLKKKEVKKQEGKSSTSLSADVRAVYKHITEKKTELTVWLEQSESLKDELQRRFSSICTIQEDITAALKEGVEEEEITFSSHQAAKFHGEVLNMKQENNMVNEELLAGIDHITTLRIESEKTLAKLDADYGLSESKPALRSGSRSRIPLRSFIFGIKAKKQKQSILSYMQHSKKAPS